MAKDPVCGMEVDETGDALRTSVSGTTYFFCTPRCKARFEEDPQRYAAPPEGNERTPHGAPSPGDTGR